MLHIFRIRLFSCWGCCKIQGLLLIFLMGLKYIFIPPLSLKNPQNLFSQGDRGMDSLFHGFFMELQPVIMYSLPLWWCKKLHRFSKLGSLYRGFSVLEFSLLCFLLLCFTTPLVLYVVAGRRSCYPCSIHNCLVPALSLHSEKYFFHPFLFSFGPNT